MTELEKVAEILAEMYVERLDRPLTYREKQAEPPDWMTSLGEQVQHNPVIGKALLGGGLGALGGGVAGAFGSEDDPRGRPRRMLSHALMGGLAGAAAGGGLGLARHGTGTNAVGGGLHDTWQGMQAGLGGIKNTLSDVKSRLAEGGLGGAWEGLKSHFRGGNGSSATLPFPQQKRTVLEEMPAAQRAKTLEDIRQGLQPSDRQKMREGFLGGVDWLRNNFPITHWLGLPTAGAHAAHTLASQAGKGENVGDFRRGIDIMADKPGGVQQHHIEALQALRDNTQAATGAIDRANRGVTGGLSDWMRERAYQASNALLGGNAKPSTGNPVLDRHIAQHEAGGGWASDRPVASPSLPAESGGHYNQPIPQHLVEEALSKGYSARTKPVEVGKGKSGGGTVGGGGGSLLSRLLPYAAFPLADMGVNLMRGGTEDEVARQRALQQIQQLSQPVRSK
jgi:hypothetical protein